MTYPLPAIPITLTEADHMAASSAAVAQGITVNELIVRVLQDYLAQGDPDPDAAVPSADSGPVAGAATGSVTWTEEPTEWDQQA